MPQIVYDLKGYPQLVYTAQDFAERKARKQPDIKQLANLLIRSIFEDGGLGRVLSIDEVTPGTPANGWTIRFTGETNGRTADPYIATYDGQVISYNDDPSRQPRDLSEGLALALEFAAKKDGQKNCNKGKPCGGSCIAKGRNCLKDKKDLSKNQQQAADTIAKAEPVKQVKPKAEAKPKAEPKPKAEAKPKAAPKKESATGKFEQIKNAKRFEEVLLQNYDKLSQDYNLGNFVPIARLRKEIGDGASDKQFDEWLVGMQRKGLIQLQGDEGDVRSPRDAVDIGGGILRTHVAIEPDGERATRGKPQQRPRAPKPANAINSATGFRDEINKLYDKLDDGNIEGVRIDRLRKELGDRVSRRQFNQWLLKMQADGVIQLAGEVTPNITKSQIEDAVQTPGGGLTSGLRFYIKRQ